MSAVRRLRRIAARARRPVTRVAIRVIRAPLAQTDAVVAVARTVARRTPVAADRFVCSTLGDLPHLAATAGNLPLARGVIDGLATSPSARRRHLAHELAVVAGDDALAERVDSTLGPEGRPQRAAARLAAAGRPDAAIDVLGPVSASGIAPELGLATALLAVGRPGDVIELIDDEQASNHPAAACHLYDALWLCGEPAAALDVIERCATSGFRASTELIARHVRASRELGLGDDRTLGVLHGREASGDQTPADELAITLLMLDRTAELRELAGERGFAARLGPTGWSTVATSHYADRDFAAARAVLPRLYGTRRHWDADKLEGRILLELGHFREAIAQRTSVHRLRPSFDEVEYFARLHVGQRREAFERYVLPTDVRRAEAAFGPTFELAATERADRRVVVPQNGPGDEILHASTYATLVSRSRHLIAGCEPRLHTLFQRSFPEVEFQPLKRLASRPAPGFLAPGSSPRAEGPLFDLLSDTMAATAAGADRVVFGRSLPIASLERPPAEPYLVADPLRVESIRRRFSPGGARLVGLVWRSEFMSAVRGIHYLRVEQLRSLARVDAEFVCLQHDVTEAERRSLADIFGESMHHVPDLDLRDDFEAAAALVVVCDAVVGVGTTTLELAAAVGTHTVALHPNLIGAWRADPNGRDYWHATMHTAVAEHPGAPASCVDAALPILSRIGIPLRNS